MELDHVGGAADRTSLDDVRIKSSLPQPLYLAFVFFDAARFPFKDFDEFVADDLAFLLGIADAFELAQKATGGVDGLETKAEFVTQCLLNLFKFVFSDDSVLHEGPGEPRVTFFVAQ